MTSRSLARLSIAAAAIVLAALFPLLPISSFYLQGAFRLLFFVALAQSWNILGGYTGYLSLGHASFVGVGGYTVGCLYFLFGLSPFVSFPLAGATAGLLALIIGVICFRIRGSYFLIATMLVLFILTTLATNLRGLTNGADGIDLPLFTDFATEARIWFYVGLGLVVLTSAVAYFIEKSAFGLNLMAIREDEDVARTMGVKVVQCKAIAFVISAALAGLLGAFYTYRAHVIEPFSAFSVELSAAPILMAILGGSRTWLGPIIGAAVYDAVSTGLTLTIGNEYSDMVFAAFLAGVVLLLPNGLIGLWEQLRSKKAVAKQGAENIAGVARARNEASP
jgi:ABC-type branched-subunit amino acid transport system permease subunit